MAIEVEIRTFLPPRAAAELEEELRAAGYEPRMAEEIIERRDASSGGALVLWVAQNIGVPAAIALATAGARWVVKRVKRSRGTPTVQIIWGPEGEVLTEVKIDPEPQ